MWKFMWVKVYGGELVIIQLMLQIKVKGNKKYSRFFIDSIKMEINNSSDTVRLLRLKTLPEHKHKPTGIHQQKIQHKQHYTLQSIDFQYSSPAAHCQPTVNKVYRWEEREQYRNLCQHNKDKSSRLSYNMQAIEPDCIKGEKLDDIRFSLREVELASKNRQSQRKAIINLDKLHSMNNKVKSKARQQSLMPLSHVQKNCKSNDQLKKKCNSYLIYTPQKASSLNYQEFLEGHCIEGSKGRPIKSIKHHFPHRVVLQDRLKTFEQIPPDQLFKENEAKAVKMRLQRREDLKKLKPLETNLSPWRTNNEPCAK